MSRISTTFAALQAKNKKALIPFITAGDPDRAATVPLMHTLVSSGANIIELGVPFSDPMADGPVIQRASERALAQGISLRAVIDIVAQFRSTDASTPIVLMGYANPIEAMGVDSFAAQAKAAGVDGVLVVDYPPEECEDFATVLNTAGIAPIFLLAPTSSEQRIKKVAALAQGYIYYVSLKGVTGAANIDATEVRAMVARIKAHSALPVGVGFGIRDAQTARVVADCADAVVIGSRIVQEIESSTPEKLLDNVRTLVSTFRTAMDKP